MEIITLIVGLVVGFVFGIHNERKWWTKKYYEMLESKEMSEVCVNCGCQEWDRQ